MCGGPETSKTTSTQSSGETVSCTTDMSNLTIKAEDSFGSLLEFASNNDVDGLKLSIDGNSSSINEVGVWYSRGKGSKHIVPDYRTPLMVAATYGNIDALKLILSCPEVDVNLSCGLHKTTALHCAASGGSFSAVDVVKLLLSAGADPNSVDANGQRPVDVIVAHPKLQSMRVTLEELLLIDATDGSVGEPGLRLSINCKKLVSSALSSSPDNEVVSPTDFISSPVASKITDLPPITTSEKKEYPIDPSIPDIKNSIYATDEFRMFSFKVRPCSRAYSHDWTECPFVHPGENASRRDPRKFHYSCVPCPEFRKGSCRRGDLCEYAHGVFECWLHPAQYRTRLCKDGTSCNRRVCFFAHRTDELRPLYVSTGSAVPSPRSSGPGPNVMDMAAALNLLPGSPSSVSAMSPSPFGQPMSPSANGISQSSFAWPQPNVPTLHLPGSNLQSSRLRSSLSVRDIPPEELSMLLEFDAQQQLMNELSCYSQPRLNSASLSRTCRSKTLTPSNLEELFSAEISSSPRYSDHLAASTFSPTHKSAVINQFQQQQNMLSPINTSVLSPKTVEHPLLQASFGVQSPRRMSPRSVEPISPRGARLCALSQHEKHQQLCSLSSRDLGSNTNGASPLIGSPASPWSKWGSPNRKPDWSVHGGGDEHSRMRRSSSFELGNNEEEPDLSWVQSLVKESPSEMMKDKAAHSVPGAAPSGGGEGLKSSNSQAETIDHSVLGAWVEQMQLA